MIWIEKCAQTHLMLQHQAVSTLSQKLEFFLRPSLPNDNLRSANYWKWQERVCRVTRDMAAPVSKCPGRPLCITNFSGPTWIKGVFPSHFLCGEIYIWNNCSWTLNHDYVRVAPVILYALHENFWQTDSIKWFCWTRDSLKRSHID